MRMPLLIARAFFLAGIFLLHQESLFTQEPDVTDTRPGIQSIQALRDHQAGTSNKEPVAFELTAQVTFRNHRELHVQDGAMPLGILINSEIAAQLAEYPIGTYVQIRGFTLPNQRKVEAEQITILEREGELRTCDSGLEPGEKRAKLLSYCAINGRVESILCSRAKNTTLIEVSMNNVGYAKIYARVSGLAETDYLLSLLGKNVRVSGTLKFPHQGRYDLMLTGFHQIEETGGGRKDLEELISRHGWYVLTGRCLYADSTRALWVETDSGELARAFRGFPDDVHYGDVLTVHGRRSELQSAAEGRNVITGMLIDILDNQIPEPIKSASVLSNTMASQKQTLPSRIRISGEVLNKRMHRNTLEYLVDCNGVRTKAYVVGSQGSHEKEPNRGDLATFTGVPKWEPSSKANELDLHLYVGRAEDASIQVSPFLIDRKSLLTTVSIAGILLIGGVIWVQCLRSQVEHRTKRLSTITSHLEASFEAVQEAILLTDNSAKVVRVNSHFKTLFGFSPEVGTSAQDCMNRVAKRLADRTPIDHVLNTLAEPTKATTHSSILINEGDKQRTVEVYASPIAESNGAKQGCLWSFQDVTNQKQLERELLQAQKMEAIGQLSGGVAHDFNNLLTVLSTNLTLLEDQVRESDLSREVDTSEFSTPMELAIQQGADLTRQLLGFARDSKLQLRQSDANHLAQRVYNLVRRTLDSTIQLSLVLEPKPLPIDVDETSLEQVLLNLCINARDAIQSHGSICLRTRLVKTNNDMDMVFIEVEDDGHGIPPEIQSRVFEPFFTTKERSRGTGLGLSTAMGVIQQLGGKIDFQSTRQAGTTFQVCLPLSENLPDSTGLLTRSKPFMPAVTRHVLLVDDEPAIRIANQHLLHKIGHRVTTAANGREAIERLRECDSVDVVLLDLTMPEMTGIEACQQIRREWPHLPVIICSGYSSMSLSAFDMDEAIQFLPKPFKASLLSATIERATAEAEDNVK